MSETSNRVKILFKADPGRQTISQLKEKVRVQASKVDRHAQLIMAKGVEFVSHKGQALEVREIQKITRNIRNRLPPLDDEAQLHQYLKLLDTYAAVLERTLPFHGSGRQNKFIAKDVLEETLLDPSNPHSVWRTSITQKSEKKFSLFENEVRGWGGF